MRPPVDELEPDAVNLIPLIDIFLVLLIFFLVATRMSQDEREISIRLAEVAKAQPLSMPPHEVVINVTEKGEYVVVGQTLDELALAGFFHDLAMKNPSTQTVQNPCRLPRAVPLSGTGDGAVRKGADRPLLHGDRGNQRKRLTAKLCFHSRRSLRFCGG